MRYTSVVSYILLELAWILLLICMPLSVGGSLYNGVITPTSGWQLAKLAGQFGIFFIPIFIMHPAAEVILPVLATAIVLSELLFIASPFVLLLSKSDYLTIIYVMLGLLCVILFTRLTPYIVDHLDPNVSGDYSPSSIQIQLLPSILVWMGAQVVLTLAAGVTLIPIEGPSRPPLKPT
jgi:hypothetical protein